MSEEERNDGNEKVEGVEGPANEDGNPDDPPLTKALRAFMKNARRNWEEKPTDIPGVDIVCVFPNKRKGKTIGTSTRRVIIRVWPLDPSKGENARITRRGLFVSSARVLQAYREALADPRLDKLVATLDAINPKKLKKTPIYV